MKFLEEIDHNRRILVIRISGTATVEEMAPVSRGARFKAKELKYGILYDLRRTQVSVSMVDAHHWADEQLDDYDQDLRLVKTAHLCNRKDSEYFRFVETSWRNNGMIVKMFYDEEKALEWLESSDLS